MKHCLTFTLMASLSTVLMASSHPIEAELPTPKYLSVPEFKSCLETMSEGAWDTWCLPSHQPKQCPDDSWNQLVVLSNDGELPPCQEIEPEPVR